MQLCFIGIILEIGLGFSVDNFYRQGTFIRLMEFFDLSIPLGQTQQQRDDQLLEESNPQINLYDSEQEKQYQRILINDSISYFQQISCTGLKYKYTITNPQNPQQNILQHGCFCPYDLYGKECQFFNSPKCIVKLINECNYTDPFYDQQLAGQPPCFSIQKQGMIKLNFSLECRQNEYYNYEGIKDGNQKKTGFKIVWDQYRLNNEFDRSTWLPLTDTAYGQKPQRFYQYVYKDQYNNISKLSNASFLVQMKMINWRESIETKPIISKFQSFEILKDKFIDLNMFINSSFQQFILFGRYSFNFDIYSRAIDKYYRSALRGIIFYADIQGYEPQSTYQTKILQTKYIILICFGVAILIGIGIYCIYRRIKKNEQ